MLKYSKITVCRIIGKLLCPIHRGGFCQFPFRWIYYCYSSKYTKKETGKTHLCAISIISIWSTTEEEVKLNIFFTRHFVTIVVKSVDWTLLPFTQVTEVQFPQGQINFQNTFVSFSSFWGRQTFLFNISNLSNHLPFKSSDRRVI